MPGRRDTVYVGMDHGKRQYKQKRYLLWKIRDLLGIINVSKVITNEQYASFPEMFQRDLSFRQLYEFLKGHKELAWNDQTPQSSCLCELCENAVLLAKGINSSLKSKILATNVPDLVEANACDSSQDVCMVRECELCLTSNLPLSDFDEENTTISFLNWQRVDKNIAKINQSLSFDQATEKWNSTILTIKKHIYRKRKQVASYNQQKLDLKSGEALIHVDYSKSYSNSQQDEVQSAYFGQQNFSIFTSCSYYRDSGEVSLTKVPLVVTSESNDHSRITAFSCIVTIVDELKKLMGELRKIILPSDGCSSQFRSKFVFALLTHLDQNIALQWNYNEAHYGKEPMGGAGGTIKRVVYGLVKSRHINIYTAAEFAAEASKGMPSIKSLYLLQEDEIIQPSFVKNAPAIKGTLDVHYIKCDYHLENVCFLEFYYLSDDKEPLHTQY